MGVFLCLWMGNKSSVLLCACHSHVTTLLGRTAMGGRAGRDFGLLYVGGERERSEYGRELKKRSNRYQMLSIFFAFLCPMSEHVLRGHDGPSAKKLNEKLAPPPVDAACCCRIWPMTDEPTNQINARRRILPM